MRTRHAQLCFVGPMLGQKNGQVPTQAETLMQLFSREGFSVWSTSSKTNRYLRFIDIASTLARRRHDMDIQMLQVFGGRSFVVEEMASIIGESSGKSIVMTLHGGSLPMFAAHYPSWTQRVLSRAAAIVAPSDYLARELTWLGFSINVIPNVLQTETYPYKLRSLLTPRLLWMRAFHDIYDPFMAVRVFAEIHRNKPDARLTMAGPDKGLLVETKALAGALGVTEAIDFAGFLDEVGKRIAGQTHDIYLNTNKIDNMPVSVLEMGAMGLPVVATDVGGIPYLLTHQKNALLVPHGDISGMADAVLHLLGHPELAERLSAGGRELALKSSWENIFPLWVQLFNRVMGK